MPTNWLPTKMYGYNPSSGQTTAQNFGFTGPSDYGKLQNDLKQQWLLKVAQGVPAGGSLTPDQQKQVDAIRKKYSDATGKVNVPDAAISEFGAWNPGKLYQATNQPESAFGPAPANPAPTINPVEAQKYFTPPVMPQSPTTPSPAATPAATTPTVPTPNTYNFSPPTNPADALSGVSNNNSPAQQQNTSYTGPAGGTRKKQFANKWFGKQQFL